MKTLEFIKKNSKSISILLDLTVPLLLFATMQKELWIISFMLVSLVVVSRLLITIFA